MTTEAALEQTRLKDANVDNRESDAVSKARFCTLAYVSTSADSPSPSAESIILLVIHEADCALRFLVHPNLKKIVDAIDLPYIETVLKDFVERMNVYASQLFNQLCSLSVGPLQTYAVGDQMHMHLDVHELSLQFAVLEN